jgi:hypothetical protein
MFGFDIKKTDNSIYSQWMQAKADEAEAIRQRRVLEDEFFAQLGLDYSERRLKDTPQRRLSS